MYGTAHAQYGTQGKCSKYIYSTASCGPRVLLAPELQQSKPNTKAVSALLPVVYHMEIRAKVGCKLLLARDIEVCANFVSAMYFA